MLYTAIVIANIQPFFCCCCSKWIKTKNFANKQTILREKAIKEVNEQKPNTTFDLDTTETKIAQCIRHIHTWKYQIDAIEEKIAWIVVSWSDDLYTYFFSLNSTYMKLGIAPTDP